MKYLVGDALEVLPSLEPASVDLVLTSPPFLGLRSYLSADHPDKDLEGGTQESPGTYIDWLLEVVEQLDRVLAPHGSLVVELGDTYSGSGAGASTTDDRWSSESLAARITPKGSVGWAADKSLTLIPELFRVALVYGFNPLTGRQTRRWRLRNVVRWVRPNPPVGNLGDKFRPATSELVVLCRTDEAGRRRYFDLEAVRVKGPGGNAGRPASLNRGNPGYHTGSRNQPEVLGNPGGAPPLDWISLPPGNYRGAHYAVWPAELLPVFVKSMSPAKVCRTCGEPSRRVVESRRLEPADDSTRIKLSANPRSGFSAAGLEEGWEYERRTVGWTDCGHDDWRPGLVLDPFAGTGTTLVVAHGHGREAIGIDLDGRNLELYRSRLGPLFAEMPPDPPEWPQTAVSGSS